MDRRTFVSLPGVAMIPPAAAASSLIKPAVLRPGDTVGLITPATYVASPDSLASMARMMEYFGLRMKTGHNVRKRDGYLGGTVEERVADLHEMFRDPEVKAVFSIRGGYGSPQLLDRIDYDLIRRNPKIFLGYSDITALHLAIHKRTGLVTMHGPMPLARFTNYTREWTRKALFEAAPLGRIANPPESDRMRPAHPVRTIRPGRAKGPLIGGNLTLVTTLMGTPFEMETRGRILFLEDVGEEPYRIDRMLTQLRLAGKLDGAAGIVIGECADCGPRDYKPSFESTLSLGEVLDNYFTKLDVPVFYGLTFGHTDDQATLPLGAMATLDADKAELVIEEAATHA